MLSVSGYNMKTTRSSDKYDADFRKYSFTANRTTIPRLTTKKPEIFKSPAFSFILILSRNAVKNVFPTILRGIAQFFLDADKLVILGNAVGA